MRQAEPAYTTPVLNEAQRSQWRYMPEQRRKTASLNLRIDPHIKEAVERAASGDRRSLTSLVEKLLTDHLRRKGYLPKV